MLLANTWREWRAALVVVSVPGLIMAAVLFLLVREPPRTIAEEGSVPSVATSFADFLRHPVLRLCFIFAGVTSCTSHALISWLPSFMMRVKGMTLLQMSAWYSVAFGASFGLGLWLGGALSDRFSRRTPLAYAFVPAISLTIAVPFIILGVMAPTWQLSLLSWTVALCMAGTFLSPAIAVVQAYAPARQATVFGSIYLLANNLVGAGLGPLYVGTVSDTFKKSMGEAALGYGMLAIIPVIVAAVAGQLLIARAIARNLPERIAA